MIFDLPLYRLTIGRVSDEDCANVPPIQKKDVNLSAIDEMVNVAGTASSRHGNIGLLLLYDLNNIVDCEPQTGDRGKEDNAV